MHSAVWQDRLNAKKLGVSFRDGRVDALSLSKEAPVFIRRSKLGGTARFDIPSLYQTGFFISKNSL